MAITNPAAIKYSNEQIRTAATSYARLYYAAKRAYADWFAQEHNTVITNDSGETVVDGAATDGRAVITGADVNTILTRLGELITDMEGSSSAKLNTILAVAVLGGETI